MRPAALLVFAIVLVGCDAYDEGYLTSAQRGGVIPGVGGGSGTGGQGGADAPTGGSTAPDGCVAGPETCNGEDDDCDTRVDENPASLCALANAEATCRAGACAVVECRTDFVDCNGRPDDGCELEAADLSCERCPATCGEADAGPSDAGPGPLDAATDAAEPDAQAPTDACLALTPSARGASCDACVCERCATAVQDCQGHSDTARATLCSDVIDCYFENDAANCGGTSTDSCNDGYNAGSGPCAGELRRAAGGVDGDDASGINAGACSQAPANNACAAASAFAACREANCADECM